MSFLLHTHSLCRWSSATPVLWSVWTATHVTLSSVAFNLGVVLTDPQHAEIPVIALHPPLLSLSDSLPVACPFIKREGQCPNEWVYLKWTQMALNIAVKMLHLSSYLQLVSLGWKATFFFLFALFLFGGIHYLGLYHEALIIEYVVKMLMREKSEKSKSSVFD